MSKESDARKEGTRNPRINLSLFIYKNYKDLIALFIIVFCIMILVCSVGLDKGVSALLISLTSGAAGFIFGNKVS